MNKTNKLWGARTYLAGPMDRVDDNGVGWRREITPFLESIGIVVLDPTNKPIDVGSEDIESRNYRNTLKQNNKYDELASHMRMLRVVDLRMVDISDFLIVYINPNIHLCGSFEELFWSNRQKRPILCMIEGTKSNTPDWLIGTLPNEHLFNNWEDIKQYISNINSGDDIRHFKRWMFFDYYKMLPKVPYGG